MFRSLTAPVVAFALLFGASSGARAALIDPNTIQWNYNFSPTASNLYADGKPGDSDARINFSNENPNTGRGSTYIVATNLTVFSSAPNTALETITGTNGKYTLNLQLGVAANGLPPYNATMIFEGRLFTKPGNGFGLENAKIENEFFTMVQEADIGGYHFKVTPYEYSGPGPANQQNKGSLRFNVEVTPSAIQQETPEPSTMVLCGLGAAFAGFAARRRKAAQPA